MNNIIQLLNKIDKIYLNFYPKFFPNLFYPNFFLLQLYTSTPWIPNLIFRGIIYWWDVIQKDKRLSNPPEIIAWERLIRIGLSGLARIHPQIMRHQSAK